MLLASIYRQSFSLRKVYLRSLWIRGTDVESDWRRRGGCRGEVVTRGGRSDDGGGVGVMWAVTHGGGVLSLRRKAD
jgi:hypothetical protein